MTAQEFIEKYSLSPVQFQAGAPVVLLQDENEQQGGKSLFDRYEFYANADRTIWLSINRTRNLFRICFHDLVSIWSDWRSLGVNYELQPLKADPPRNK